MSSSRPLSSTLASATLVALAALAAPAAHAEDGPTVEQRLNDLDQQIRILQRRAEIAGEEAAAKAKTGAGVFVNDKDGIGLKSNDGNLRLRLRGLVQLDGRFFLNDEAENGQNTQFNNALILRTIRPIIETSIYKTDVVFVPDYGNGAFSLSDLYVDLKQIPDVTIRVGKYTPPIGLERWQSNSALIFPERALATNLVPNRDVGIQASGEPFGGTFSYAVGIFNGTPDAANLSGGDATDDKDVVGRINVTPFRNGNEWFEQLGIGVAASFGHEGAGAALPTYRTYGQNAFFTYNQAGVQSYGARARVNPHLRYFNGPFGLLAEYVASSQEWRRAARRDRLTNTSWHATASYVLTGENATWRAVSPATTFDPDSGGWGAFELTARVGRLDIDDEAYRGATGYATRNTQASSATELGVGINWYWNRYVKWQADYVRTTFDEGAGTVASVQDRQTEQVINGRLQIVF